MLLQLGSQVPEFSLPDTQGSLFSRSEALGRPLLVMFWCNHCPFVQHIRPAILECTKTFRARGVTVIAINSNDPAAVPSDSLAHMQAEAEHHGYPFPYLCDETGQVGRRFHATCTPDFFLFDAGHRLVYRGAFDRSSPGNGAPVDGALLSAAVEAVLSGRPPIAPQHPSLGCSIKWRPLPAEAADTPAP